MRDAGAACNPFGSKAHILVMAGTGLKIETESQRIRSFAIVAPNLNGLRNQMPGNRRALALHPAKALRIFVLGNRIRSCPCSNPRMGTPILEYIRTVRPSSKGL
jgi:hypothetical protein